MKKHLFILVLLTIFFGACESEHLEETPDVTITEIQELTLINGYLKDNNGLYYSIMKIFDSSPYCLAVISDTIDNYHYLPDTLTIPNELKVSGKIYKVGIIDKNAFNGCANIKKVILPDELSLIGDSAFQHSGIQTLEINNNAYSFYIRTKAFSNCKQLTQVTLETINMDISYGAFMGCDKLTIVNYNTSRSGYFEKHLSLNEDGVPLFPSSVTKVNLGPNVKVIPRWAFAKCNNLKSVSLPATLERIEVCAFISCGLDSIVFPSSLKYIAAYAFASCPSFTTIELPKSIEYLGDGAFVGCCNVLDFKCRGLAPPNTENLFLSAMYFNPANHWYGCNEDKLITLYLPKGSKSNYAASVLWSKFRYVKEFN